MNDDTRLDCSDIPCSKHQKYYAQSCPECEIDWLKKELKAVNTENEKLRAGIQTVINELPRGTVWKMLIELLKGGEE